MSKAVLMVTDVAKRCGSFSLDRISFEVREGEIFGLLGPQKSGKSLLLSVLSGQVKPDQGTVLLQGINLYRQERQARALFGLVPQHPDINTPDGDPTPRLLLEFEAGLRGIASKYREERIAESLERTGLSRLEHLHMSAFSTGMKKRLSLARALLHRPRVLYVDALTENVDDEEQRLLWRILIALQGRGITLLFSSAHSEEVTTLCHRFVVLEDGALQDTLDVSELPF